MILRDPQLLAVPQMCLLPKVPVFFLAVGYKVLVLRYFINGCKLFLLLHKSRFAMRSAKCLLSGTGCHKKILVPLLC